MILDSCQFINFICFKNFALKRVLFPISSSLNNQSFEWFYNNVKKRFKRFGSAKVVRSLYKRKSDCKISYYNIVVFKLFIFFFSLSFQSFLFSFLPSFFKLLFIYLFLFLSLSFLFTSF